MVQIRINKDIGQTFNKMNEVKILSENINIAKRENFESGNVLLNFNTCQVQARNQGGCTGCVRTPPQAPKVRSLILNIQVKECSGLK